MDTMEVTRGKNFMCTKILNHGVDQRKLASRSQSLNVLMNNEQR